MVTTDRVDVMIEPDFLRFDTLSLHAGQQPDPTTGARAVPLYFTTSYVFDDSDPRPDCSTRDARASLLAPHQPDGRRARRASRSARRWGRGGLHGERSGSLLSRGRHPDGPGRSHRRQPQHLWRHPPDAECDPSRLGITTTFVDPRDPQAFEDAITDETRLVFAETLGNPGVEVLDIPAVAEVAHRHGLPLMVDSTFSTPYCIRPIEHGADIVMHSVTKFLGGHGVALGGALVDGGRFDWEASGRFDTMTEPYVGYHGISFADEFGPRPSSPGPGPRACATSGGDEPGQRLPAPAGRRDLPLRMARHVENARAVTEMLEANDAVAWVKYPTASDHPDRALAAELYPNGTGAILSFGVKGGRAAGKTFIENVKLASHLANVGDAKTLVLHPASTTHQQLSAEDLEAAGIGEDLIRVSVGIEDVRDIIDDLSTALKISQR